MATTSMGKQFGTQFREIMRLEHFEPEHTDVWPKLSRKQQHAIQTFARGEYQSGDQVFPIVDLEGLQRANHWIMWVLSRDDYRHDVLGAAQSQIVIPLFKQQVLRLSQGHLG